jgi:hypothetical protein
MFRRVATKAPTMMTGTCQARSYFFVNPGEQGIWGKTMKNMCRNIAVLFALCPFALYKVAFIDRNNCPRQFITDASDFYESDGTELEGEEAVANLRIYRERIMPFMDDYNDRIEAASESS